jgi:hypothetical protein
MQGGLPQLSPVGRVSRARSGLGSASFADYSSNASFTASWQTVGAQLTSEGSGPGSLAYTTAQNAFADTYQQLYEQLGADPSEALASAQQYMIGAHTILGASQTVAGLLSAAASGVAPAQAVQLFTGTMIGVAVLAGAVSAGVGAGIIGAVSALGSILQSAGLFGSSPGFTIPGCGDSTLSAPPAYSVGCVGVYGLSQVVSPTSSDWKHFPVATNPADAGWFDRSGTGWSGKWGNWVGLAPSGVYRLIDQAFPEYHLLECEQRALAPSNAPAFQQAVADFQRTFFAAWKANKEYALNGLKPQPDWQVLLHAVRMWNASHDAGTGYQFLPSPKNLVVRSDCSDFGASYEAMLVEDVLDSSGDPAKDAPGGAILINTGASLAPVAPNPLARGVLAKVGAKGAASAPMSTTAKIATGAAVAVGGGLAAAAIYAFVKHQAFGAVLEKAWDKTGGRVFK